MKRVEINPSGIVVNINNYADFCPRCHHAIEPNLIATTANTRTDEDNIVDIAFKCPRLKCGRLFISSYSLSKYDNIFYFNESVPLKFQSPNISDEIKKVSPAFENIFGQATQADSSGLDQIAGVGYRKALEFLIKDFCIRENEGEEDKIKKMFLGNVIKDYVDDKKMEACAKRAAWLGNDETHYVRKWENKDIDDLKILIKLTGDWVSYNVLTKQYMTDMPE